jgi:hypothetical protein
MKWRSILSAVLALLATVIVFRLGLWLAGVVFGLIWLLAEVGVGLLVGVVVYHFVKGMSPRATPKGSSRVRLYVGAVRIMSAAAPILVIRRPR